MTRICAIGDSHTTGGRYLAEVHARLGGEGIAVGLVGHGARVIAGRLPEVLATRPTHVIVQAGVNDLAAGRSLAHTQAWLGAMYRAIHAADAQVIAIPILPWAGYLDRPRLRARKAELLSRTRALNAWLAAERAAGRIDALVDVDAMGPPGGALDARYARKDGLHLTAEGQRALGRLVAEGIRAASEEN